MLAETLVSDVLAIRSRHPDLPIVIGGLDALAARRSQRWVRGKGLARRLFCRAA